MREPAFAETALDFGMFVWGSKGDRLRRPIDGVLVDEIVAVPTAIGAAQAAAANGDFLGELFNLHPPAYLFPPRAPGPLDKEHAALSTAELYDKYYREAMDPAEELRKKYEQKPPLSDAEYCREFAEVMTGSTRVSRMFAIGYFSLIFIGPLSPIEGWYINDECRNPSGDRLTIDAAKRIAYFYDRDSQFLRASRATFDSYPMPKTLDAIRGITLNDFGIRNSQWTPFTVLGGSLPNSSTNMNRKRANFILRNFFCDNLTPINVEEPAMHAGDRHGTEASCRSCHYKLDPMAGFFAKHGASFADFGRVRGPGEKSELIFDDGARADLQTYLENWQDKSTGKWNIGYVRSLSHPAMNTYGETLDDLFKILREAPEVRACLVRKIFEYTIAPEQSIDAGYLEYATKEFNCVAEKKSSTAALKQTMARALLSQTFSQRDRNTEECYDFAPGGASPGAPPCRVAVVLQRNCVSCHDSTGAKGRLDLSRWVKVGDEYTFPHLDRKGQQRPKQETFDRIGDRLSTTDEKERMPLDRYMHPLDREKIFIWVNEWLNQGSQS